MKLFYSVNRLLLVLLTVSFLISSSDSFSQTALSFTTIPTSDPDLVAPGRGAEQWHDRTDVNIPVEGNNTRPMDVYYRFVATRISTNTQGVYSFVASLSFAACVDIGGDVSSRSGSDLCVDVCVAQSRAGCAGFCFAGRCKCRR